MEEFMKLLYVYGIDEDTKGPEIFENSSFSTEDIILQMTKMKSDTIALEIDGEGVAFELKSFGEVDPKFMSFLEDEKFIDYKNERNDYYVLS